MRRLPPGRAGPRFLTLPLSSLLPIAVLSCLAALIASASADSRPRNPLRAIARVEDPILHTSGGGHSVHAHSVFQISLTLAQEGRRLPVRLRLQPNHNILADNAAIHHINADGSVDAEPINRLDHRVFMGDAFVSPDKSTGTANWVNAGWASIYVHVDGEHPIFEGAFHLAGDHHHIQTSHNYRDTRIAGDPVTAEAEDDAGADEYMVVWRDSDILPDATPNDVELRRRLQQRGVAMDNMTMATGDGAAALLPPACSSDGLFFNQDGQHPIYSGVDLDGKRRHRGDSDDDDDNDNDSGQWVFGRQIDGSGDTGGGNAGGVNLASTIGNPAGCPTTRKIALMGIAADCNYASAFGSKANASNNIIQQINSASRVYESTFNISLGIQNLIIQNNSCPTASSTSATPWNAGCSSDLTITDRLNLFSKWRGESANDTNALWMLLSTCATDSAVGVAWLGQLCVAGAHADGGSSSGSNETIASTNVVVRTSTEWQVMAHETGHTFGAVHDCTSTTCSDGTVSKQQCCPLSANECNANGQFIMNPSTGSGITAFSSCTLGNVCSALGRNSVKSACLSNNKNVVTITGSECGNGIVEEGEECDCGGADGCAASGNSCCDPTTCKFSANALCDPSNDECCTTACQLAGPGTVCRASTGPCDPAETCSGTSAACPADTTLPDGTSCASSDNSDASGDSGLQCASGQCTSRDLQCKTLMGSLTTDNDTYACSAQGCQLSCASPEFGPNTCLSMDQNFLDGTPCQGGGHCSNGNCADVSVAKEIKFALRHHLDIVIPVAVVVGLLVLVLLASCVMACVRRRRRQRRLRELARNGMAPPPLPPSRMRGWFGFGGKTISKGAGYGGGSGGGSGAGSGNNGQGDGSGRSSVSMSHFATANNISMSAIPQRENGSLPPPVGVFRARGYGEGVSPQPHPPSPGPQWLPAGRYA